MKILLLDVETSPNTVFTWGLFKQTISIDKIIDSSEVLCIAYKWLGEKDTFYLSKHNKKFMLRSIHKMLEEADAVVTYNGNSFDLPVLNKELLLEGFTPPAPYKSIDLCKVVQKRFRFPSSKLEYVCGALGLETKVKHEGFKLWVQCMAGDEAAWKRMQRYNRQDVRILEQLYQKLKPWVPSHPNHGTFDDLTCCPNCGSTKLQRRGLAHTQHFSYARYQCQECGAWSRSSAREKAKRKDRRVGVAQ